MSLWLCHHPPAQELWRGRILLSPSPSYVPGPEAPGVQEGTHAYLTAAGLPRGPQAASLITACKLLVWRRKAGVGRVEGNDTDIVWADEGRSGAAPQGSWGLHWAPELEPGGQQTGGPGEGGWDTHWWACTSHPAGWGCPHIRGHSWGRERVVSGTFMSPLGTACFPQPPAACSPLTAAACVAWGTCITCGLAICVQEAGV